jgi:hypothetical protein
LTHSFGLKQPEPSPETSIERKPCVHVGEVAGTFDCSCGSVDTISHCEKLGGYCMTAKPIREGVVAGVDVAWSDIKFCSSCSDHETDWNRKLVQWREPKPMQIEPSSNTALVTVAIGFEWRRILRATKPLMQAYATRHGLDFIAITDKTQQWGPLEKFRCRELLEHYERIIFVDADVVISPDAPMLRCDGIGMHDDWDALQDRQWISDEWAQLAKSQQVAERWQGRCYNSGVICCDREHRDLFTPPSQPFYATHCAEQFWLEWNAIRLGYRIESLQWRWNAQFWQREFQSKARSAHFVHLANAPHRLQAVRDAVTKMQAVVGE